MREVERDIMRGMISILNKHSDALTQEQYNMRLEDLKQFEEETGFAYMNSPTCTEGMTQIGHFPKCDFKKCNDVEKIAELIGQNEIVVYPNLIGTNMSVTYADGIMTYIRIDNFLLKLDELTNVPYKINKKETYIVEGKVSDMKFYVYDVIDGGCGNVRDSLKEAKELGFDIVKNWFASNFKPKNMQSNIDYVFEYAEEEELSIDGVVFRCNDRDDGLVYKKSEE